MAKRWIEMSLIVDDDKFRASYFKLTNLTPHSGVDLRNMDIVEKHLVSLQLDYTRGRETFSINTRLPTGFLGRKKLLSVARIVLDHFQTRNMKIEGEEEMCLKLVNYFSSFAEEKRWN